MKFSSLIKLGECCDVKGGKRLPKGTRFSDQPTPHPYIRVVDFHAGTIDTANLKYIDESVHSKIKRYTITSNDLYISIAGTLGLVGEVPKELSGANLTENAAKLVIKRSNVDKKYLKHVLTSPRIQKQIHEKMGAGGGVPKLALFRIQDLELPLYSPQEQEHISETLDTWDKGIFALQQLQRLALLEKTAIASKCYSSNDNKPLAELCSFLKDGTHFSPKSKSGPFMYLTSKNIRFGYLDLTNISTVSEIDHSRIYSSCPTRQGDVLLTKDGANTGNAAINTISVPISLLSSVAVLRGKEGVLDNHYLLQYLLSPRGQSALKAGVEGQAITRLTLTKISAFKIPMAPFERQVKIGRTLSEIDRFVEHLRRQQELYNVQKIGLMQHYFGGVT